MPKYTRDVNLNVITNHAVSSTATSLTGRCRRHAVLRWTNKIRIIFIQKESFTPFTHRGQTPLINAAVTSTPAALPTRKQISPGLVEQGGALSGVAAAFHALLAECWDLGGGHGNWAEIIYSGWGAWQGPPL